MPKQVSRQRSIHNRVRLTEDVTEASVRKKIAKTFPSFDERIGWSIHGVYDDEGLPGDVEERLSAFFRPHDDAFFEILGRRLPWRN